MHIVPSQRLFVVAVWFIAGASLLFASLLVIFLVPYAEVSIIVESEPVQTVTEVTLDPDINLPLPALDTLPDKISVDRGEVIATQFDESESSEFIVFKSANSNLLFTVKKQLLFDFCRSKVSSLLNEGSILKPGSLRLVVNDVFVGRNSTTAHITLSISGQVVPQNDYRKLLNKLSSHDIDALQSQIAALPHIQSVMIRTWPSFWPWLPYLNSRVRFSLDIL
ncbi:MAG: hypothetical protein WC817_03320 [Patescibacteria group bacterium]|jgi:hypothetical protein